MNGVPPLLGQLLISPLRHFTGVFGSYNLAMDARFLLQLTDRSFVRFQRSFQ